MANPEHLEILKQGVEKWNAWRKAHPEIRPDLRDAFLCNTDFHKANFRNTDFFGANLSESYLTRQSHI